MPIFIMTADINAETLLGATGCAFGSQVCNGTIPAFVPNPTKADTNIRFLTKRGNEGDDVLKESKPKLPVWRYPSKNETKISAVPKCVMTRYVIPDFTFSSLSWSYITKKNDVSDINSQNIKKKNPLFDPATRIIDKTNTLKRKTKTDIRFLDSYYLV